MLTNYKLIGKRYKLVLRLTFLAGDLQALQIDAANLDKAQRAWLLQHFPWAEAQLDQLAPGFTIARLDEQAKLTIKDKILLFNSHYQQLHNVAYEPTTKEKGLLKNMRLTDAIVAAYMAAREYPFKGPKGIADLQRHWNAAKALSTGLVAKHPDYYNYDYDKGLKQAQRQEYYQHLVSKGWKKEYNPTGGTRWVEKDSL